MLMSESPKQCDNVLYLFGEHNNQIFHESILQLLHHKICMLEIFFFKGKKCSKFLLYICCITSNRIESSYITSSYIRNYKAYTIEKDDNLRPLPVCGFHQT